MAESLRLAGKILGAVVSEKGGRWFVSITVEMNQPQPVQFSQPVVGIDLGIKKLAVLSDGTYYPNQELVRSELAHLKYLSRRLSRRQMGSKRWYKAKEELVRFHARIANQRTDYLHKMTTEIASTFAVIGIEDLNVIGMLKNHRHARSIADASFGEIRRLLTYKSEWLGGKVVAIHPFYPSSKLCSFCGALNQKLTLKDREWVCPICYSLHDRDLNAALNIEIEASRLLNDPR